VGETYTLHGHGLMIADPVRMDAYQAALERTVRPGCVVLDIGTGTGLMAMMACRLGARRVYAVEPGDSIHLARAAARDSGFADRIEFIQDVSTRVQLPERADVIVSDLRGVLPVFQQHVRSLADAYDRLLVPGGVLIPRADTLRVAPVQAESDYRGFTAPWTEHARGFDLSAPRRAVLNSWSKSRIRAEQLVAEPRTWAVLEYGTRREPDVRGTLEWTVERGGTAHGLAVWFHADLVEGVGFTTGPEGPESIYGSGFFPWAEPVPLREGDAVAVDLQARHMGADHVWVWNTTVRRADGPAVTFRQSTFLSQPSTLRDLRKRAHGFTPTLDEDGRIDGAVLGMMDGSATLEQIAREMRRRFPERFGTWEEALSRVGRLSQAYAR
jgi:type I protein arginine methyltransferase